MPRLITLLICLFGMACSTTEPLPDVRVEGGMTDHRGPDRLGSPDRSADHARPDSATCGAGLDLSPLVLASDLCVVRRTALPWAPAAVALRGGTVWGLHGTTTASDFHGEVTRWTIDGAGKLGSATSVLTFTETTTSTVFAGEYLALAPASDVVAVGYTLDKTFDGAVYWGPPATSPKKVSKAQGNYDAVLLDDTTLLLNGFGAESAQQGQGVYVIDAAGARRLIKDLGAMSGPLVITDVALVAGGYFTKGTQLYGFSLAEIKAAIAGGKELSASGDGDLVYSGAVLDAASLGDALALSRADATTFAFTGVALVPLTVSGDKVTAGAVKDAVTLGGSETVARLASGGAQLGLLIGSELAVVQRK
jgi:hypothetical protein